MSDHTSSAVTISAPPADILGVIADFASYPDWADGIKAADVVEHGADGRPARVRFTIDAGLVKDTYTLGYSWDGLGVRWELVEAGSALSAMTGSYTLAEQSPSATDVTYELSIALRVPVPGIMRRRGERQIVDTALKGLRRRVERG
ncbi:SRPBCC family protein [Nocardiopsis ansamitocini]|uniref:Cyclase n=1 Tax=Nocardiopsis ansamitocini TaxID=1670832 RepID=A0A9W6P2R4_9ACTN|nr:SRPBCC family protein [Nocardiopsis ansamitocini]GLU46076.1 cyclase [Nocardiopsis ansamitocini]